MNPLRNAAPGSCGECGYAFPSWDEMKEHMVSMHAFQRVGAQIFRRELCACGKPGLYRVGTGRYCKEHVALANARRSHACKSLIEVRAGLRERQFTAIERTMTDADKARRLNQRRSAKA